MTQAQQLGARSLAALRLARRSGNARTHHAVGYTTTLGIDAMSSRSQFVAASMTTPAASQRRSITSTRTVAQRKTPQSSEATEAMLAQQMLDFMAMSDDTDDSAAADSVASELSITGVVLDVKNHIASISGLRHATVGSVVAITSIDESTDAAPDATDDKLLCRGVVLSLHKKVAHVALLSERSRIDAPRSIRKGQHVTLESRQLEIPASVAAFAGRVVDPLGAPIDAIDTGDSTDATASTTDRIAIAWGPQTVPKLMHRRPLKEPLATGIRAIDCFHPLACGHRLAVLGHRNSGKTRVALDAIIHILQSHVNANKAPPHVVYVSIGKPATRVQQVRDVLSAAGILQHVTIVAADERASLVQQFLAPFTGVAIAEFGLRHGIARHSIVVYDELATHTVVVEQLVALLKLPRIAHVSLSGHAVLMERSAAFVASGTRAHTSLTTLALADAPDSSAVETTAFAQTMRAITDDAIVLESTLARQRVFPPIDVLARGASIRGPPFQSLVLWTLMTQLRSVVNAASLVEANVATATALGLEIEPENAEVLVTQQRVQQFFAQVPSFGGNGRDDATDNNPVALLVGLRFLIGRHVHQLPVDVAMWDFIATIEQQLVEKAPEVVHLIETLPRDALWPQYVDDAIEQVVVERLAALKVERRRLR